MLPQSRKRKSNHCGSGVSIFVFVREKNHLGRTCSLLSYTLSLSLSSEVEFAVLL